MLWLCVYLPLLPLEVFKQVDLNNTEQPSENKALVVLQEQKVLLCNKAANDSGIEPGLTLNTAHSLSEALLITERDQEKESKLLQYLAESAYQFSSAVSCYQNHHHESSLLLEVGGSLKLFDGIDNLQQQLSHLLKTHPLADAEGFKHQFSIAKTPKAAELLARYYYQKYAGEKLITDTSDLSQIMSAPTAERLKSIPIVLLDVPEKPLKQCLSMGLNYLNELLALPKAALAKRFNHDFILYLQQLTGRQSDPQKIIKLPAYFEREQFYIDGLRSHAELIFPIEKLLKEFCLYLQVRQLQSRGIEWVFHRYSKQKNAIQISCSEPQSQYASLLSLSKIKLEKLPLDSPVETIRLIARDFELAELREDDFFHTKNQAYSANLLADKLIAKLGQQALSRVDSGNHHLPEINNRLKTLSKNTAGKRLNKNSFNETHNNPPARPAWLLEQPEKLLSIDSDIFYRSHKLQLLKGPERIEGNWWKKSSSRDYFIAAQLMPVNKKPPTSNKNQHPVYQAFYWVYYDRKIQHWYLHGLFS